VVADIVVAVKPLLFNVTPGVVIVVADIVFADNPFVKFVAPDTVPPVKEVPVLVLNPVTLNVPPVLFVNIAVPDE